MRCKNSTVWLGKWPAHSLSCNLCSQQAQAGHICNCPIKSLAVPLNLSEPCSQGCLQLLDRLVLLAADFSMHRVLRCLQLAHALLHSHDMPLVIFLL